MLVLYNSVVRGAVSQCEAIFFKRIDSSNLSPQPSSLILLLSIFSTSGKTGLLSEDRDLPPPLFLGTTEKIYIAPV